MAGFIFIDGNCCVLDYGFIVTMLHRPLVQGTHIYVCLRTKMVWFIFYSFVSIYQSNFIITNRIRYFTSFWWWIPKNLIECQKLNKNKNRKIFARKHVKKCAPWWIYWLQWINEWIEANHSTVITKTLHCCYWCLRYKHIKCFSRFWTKKSLLLLTKWLHVFNTTTQNRSNGWWWWRCCRSLVSK